MTRLVYADTNGVIRTDWHAVELHYGERAALMALDAVMATARELGEPFEWEYTKAQALAILRRDTMPGSSHAAGLRDTT